MKRLFRSSALLVITIALLLTGCMSASIKMTKNNAPALPYSRILAVYLDDPCDLTPFDSTSYDICVRSSFLNPEKTPLRNRIERMVADDVAHRSAKSTIICSSDVFDMSTNSYADFRKEISNRKIDAILLINFRQYSHSSAYGNNILPHFGPSGYGNVDYKKTTHNAGFECFLFTPQLEAVQNTKKDSSLVWEAQIETKGNAMSGKKGLTREMTQKISQTLLKNGYIYH